ncbi:hypothetical protein [Bifidobacterium stellenboschense]|uniref:Uncharacterized protein n=1 Tax=Bifidobacterium stellenboschense TaxID=762211 RepID=A0A087DQP9_9BIFI|nr:hypothetical protein [Bifidobacterium stellenboschense]KFI97849.1 hypothetical protein BSTEL_0660 [Bifidobacterium stellenboschense]
MVDLLQDTAIICLAVCLIIQSHTIRRLDRMRRTLSDAVDGLLAAVRAVNDTDRKQNEALAALTDAMRRKEARHGRA